MPRLDGGCATANVSMRRTMHLRLSSTVFRLGSESLVGVSRAQVAVAPRLIVLDAEVEWRRRVSADAGVQEVLRRLGPVLRDVHTPPTTGMRSRRHLPSPLHVCMHEKHPPPTTGLMKARPPAWRFSEMYALLGRCGLLHDVQMPRLSAIVGDPATATAFSLKVTNKMVLRAWLAMRLNPLSPGVRPPAPTSGSAVVLSTLPHASWMVHPKGTPGADKGVGDFINGGGLRLDEDGGGTTFEEWVEVLIRVGEARYRNVRCGLPPDDSSPPVAVCAEAILQHVGAVRSEVESIQEARPQSGIS